jgi:hypothetical protein
MLLKELCCPHHKSKRKGNKTQRKVPTIETHNEQSSPRSRGKMEHMNGRFALEGVLPALWGCKVGRSGRSTEGSDIKRVQQKHRVRTGHSWNVGNIKKGVCGRRQKSKHRVASATRPGHSWNAGNIKKSGFGRRQKARRVCQGAHIFLRLRTIVITTKRSFVI